MRTPNSVRPIHKESEMAAARQMYGGLRIAAEGGAGAPAPLPIDAQSAFLSVFFFFFCYLQHFRYKTGVVTVTVCPI